jgi:hypothetical protein
VVTLRRSASITGMTPVLHPIWAMEHATHTTLNGEQTVNRT